MRALELNIGDLFEDRMNKGTLRVVDGDPIGLGTKVIAVTEDNRVVQVHSDSLVFPVEPSKAGGTLPFTMEHHSLNGKKISGRVKVASDGIEVFFDGYGTHNCIGGAPLFVEVGDDGHPVARVWNEVDGQDPSHKIGFAGARDKR